MNKPILERQSESKKSRHALAAANIRKELKHYWPKTQFSVTSESYTGGSSIRVKWIDGATKAEVEKIVYKYQYGSFNSMEDIYENEKDFDSSYGEAKYTFCERSYTKESYQEAIEATKYSDSDLKLIENEGSYYIDGDWESAKRAHSYLSEKSFYPVEAQEENRGENTNQNQSFANLIAAGTIEEKEHTQTKEPLKILKLNQTLSKESFKEFLEYIKQEGIGYYSRFVGGVILYKKA